jgi:hypothetical protein
MVYPVVRSGIVCKFYLLSQGPVVQSWGNLTLCFIWTISFYRVIVTKGNVELIITNVLNSGLAVGFRLIFLLKLNPVHLCFMYVRASRSRLSDHYGMID